MEFDAKRRADVQGLRALAIVLVVAHHGGVGLPGGFIGVDVFFVISGYVISRLLVSELETRNDLSLRHFYARRAKRLLPALALLLVVVCLVAGLLLSPLGPQQQAAGTTLGASTFTANIQLFLTPKGYFDPDTSTNALLHTWSLSVEEQFYFIYPVTLLLLWRVARRWTVTRLRAVVAVPIALVLVLSFTLSWLTSNGYGSTLAHALGGGPSELAFYMPMTRAWEFAAGILVCLLAPAAIRSSVATVLGLIGLALVGIAALMVSSTDPFPGTAALLPVGGTALLLVAGTSARAPTSRVLAARPLTFLGDISYGWYLWHWPLIVFGDALWPQDLRVTMAAALLSLVLGWVSFRFIENPLRTSQQKDRRAYLIALACIALSIAAALGLRAVARLEASSARPRFVATALQPHADEVHGCSHGARVGTRPSCTWPGSEGAVYLLGDSNAGHFTEPVAAAAERQGRSFTVATRSSCPFVDLVVEVPRRDADACHAFVRDSVATLVARKPALVIIASASTTYLENSTITFRRADGARASSHADKIAWWEAGTRAIVDELGRAGVPSVVVHAVPRLEGLSLATCPYVRIQHDPRSCGITVPRTQIETQQRAAREAERRAVAGIPLASTLDLTDALCTPVSCAALHADDWVYRDDGHLTVRAARRLTPEFTRLLETRLAR